MIDPLAVFCRYCLALPGERCRSHQRGCAYPPGEPVYVKVPHIERLLAARSRRYD